MTFVKTRLQIEKMSSGETLEIRLRGAEPLENVPASVVELGHEVISVTPEPAGDDLPAADTPHRVLVRLSGG